MKIESIVVELIDVCNLNCSYCLRDESALHGRPHALPIETLVRTLEQARAFSDRCQVQFTGGEPTLHPDFRLALKAVSDMGWRFSVITNGWAFVARGLPAVLEFKDALGVVAFSLDGVTREDHDALRGHGSFERLMRSVLACRHHGLPFDFKVTFDRKKGRQLERFALFAARVGARGLQAGPLFPTGGPFYSEAMSVREQQSFLTELGILKKTLKLELEVAAGFYDPRPEPTCGPLRKNSLNVDYRGRLGLCTVLAGFRGQKDSSDVIADLKTASLSESIPKLSLVASGQNELRARTFAHLGSRAHRPSLGVGSPCLHCLCAFGKIQPDLLNSDFEETPMNDDVSFLVPDSIIASDFDGKEALILDTSTQRYHTLNETATFLWSAIENGKTVSQMTAALCAAFDVDAVRARASVEKALGRLESQSLIRTNGR